MSYLQPVLELKNYLESNMNDPPNIYMGPVDETVKPPFILLLVPLSHSINGFGGYRLLKEIIDVNVYTNTIEEKDNLVSEILGLLGSGIWLNGIFFKVRNIRDFSVYGYHRVVIEVEVVYRF